MSAREASQHHADLARRYMKEAILDLLASSRQGLAIRRIADVLDLPQAGEGARFRDTALGHLQELRREGRAEHPRGGDLLWRLTSEERGRRRNDGAGPGPSKPGDGEA